MRTLAIVRVIKGKYLMCYDLNSDELPVLEVGGAAPCLPEIGDEDLVCRNVSEILKYKDGWLPLCTHFIDVEHFAEMYIKCTLYGIQICHCFKCINKIHASDDIKKIISDNVQYMSKSDAEAIRNKQIAEICDEHARWLEEWERENQ